MKICTYLNMLLGRVLSSAEQKEAIEGRRLDYGIVTTVLCSRNVSVSIH